MNEALKKLLADFNTKSARAQEILGMGEALTAELIAEAQTLNTEIAGIKAQIETVKSLGDNVDEIKKLTTTPVSSIPFSGASGATLLGFEKAGESQIDRKTGLVEHDGKGLVDDKQWEAINTTEYKSAWLHYVRQKETMSAYEYKSLNEGTDSAGGFLVPADMMLSLLAKAPAPTSLVANVTSLTCNRDTLNIPKVQYTTDNTYTSGMRVTWTGEQPAASTTARVTAPVFGQVSVPVYTAMMSLLLTNDFVEDSAIDILGWIRDKFNETISLLDEDMILNGTGSNQPLGLIPSVYTTTVDTEVFGKIKQHAIGASDVITTLIEELPFLLPEQYHGNAKWCYQLASAGLQISKVKDTSGRPIYGGSLNEMSQGPGGRYLLGYPVITSALAGTCGGTSDTYNVFFGDFKGYSLVRRIGFSVQVLNETYAETNAKCLLGRYRLGGAPTEEWRIVCGKVPT